MENSISFILLVNCQCQNNMRELIVDVQNDKAKPTDKISPVEKKSKVLKEETKPELDTVEGKYITEVGAGGCRGKNWNLPPFPLDQGRLSKTNCAKVCIKNGCTSFHLLHEEGDGTSECFLFGHSNVLTVPRLGGFCYSLSDSKPAVGVDSEVVVEEELKGPVFMSQLGRGRCRGPGWTFGVWPLVRGFRTAQNCAETCARTRGCTAFDLIEEQSDGTFGCTLYAHQKLVVASGVPGTCHVLSDGSQPAGDEEVEEELKLTGPVHMALLGSGRCRGPNWTSNKWPVLKGFTSPRQCAEECAKKRGCKAFDLSNPEDNSFDCVLYGHAKVVPASGVPGNCYVLSEKEGVVPGGLNTVVTPDEEEEEEENVVTGDVEFHKLGVGRCRGRSWTSKKWPVIKGFINPKENVKVDLSIPKLNWGPFPIARVLIKKIKKDSRIIEHHFLSFCSPDSIY